MIRSAPSITSKPPPTAIPLTAAMTGFQRFCGVSRPPKPPSPQSPSMPSPSAAALRSQPALKNFSPAPVKMPTFSVGSSRNNCQASLSSTLVCRSIALALGRSRTTSRTPPCCVVRTAFAIFRLQCVREESLAGGHRNAGQNALATNQRCRAREPAHIR